MFAWKPKEQGNMDKQTCSCGRSVYKRGDGFSADKGYWEVDNTISYPFPKRCPGCDDELLDQGKTKKA